MANKYSKRGNNPFDRRNETALRYTPPAEPVFDDEEMNESQNQALVSPSVTPPTSATGVARRKRSPSANRPVQTGDLDERLERKIKSGRRMSLNIPKSSRSFYLRNDVLEAVLAIADISGEKPGEVIRYLLEIYAEDNPESLYAKKMGAAQDSYLEYF